MKKFLSLLLSLLLVFVTIPLCTTFAADKTSGTTGDCTWTLNGTELTISGNGKMGDYTWGSPWSNDAITNVTINNGVSNIGNCAFSQCRYLNKISIPNSVKKIGTRAFWQCKEIKSINFPNSIEEYGSEAFLVSGLTSIVIPSGKILAGAFSTCTSLKKVVIGKNVMSIKRDAFEYCSSLTDIYYDGTKAQFETVCEGTLYINNNVVIHYNSPICNSIGHSYTSQVISPSCKSQGYTKYTCINCNYSYTTSYTAKIPHVYSYECDDTCNVCGEKRSVTHSYNDFWSKNNSTHWYECEVCGNRKETAYHEYDNNCDATCNVCEYVRTVVHQYDNNCDIDCNICGTVRTVNPHSYKKVWSSDEMYHWYECEVCGFKTDIKKHEYDNICDSVCNICGAIRETVHENSKTVWTFDGINHWHECSICHEKTDVSNHIYDNECDTTCNICEYTRQITHQYKTEYLTDDAYHWRECSVCGIKTEKEEHTFNDKGICLICDYKKYIVGDIDGKEEITSDDAIYLLHHIFEPEEYPVNQPVDFNGDGSLTSDDAIYLLHHLFEPEDYPLH